MDIGYQVGLSEAFPEEENNELARFLAGISKDKVLYLGAALLAEQFKDHDRIYDLLGTWFRTSNQEFADAAYERLLPLERRFGKLSIANIPAALKIFTYAFNNLNDSNDLTDEQIEINIFKSFLLLNQQMTSQEATITATTENLPFQLRWYALHFANTVRYSDFVNFDLFQVFVTEFLHSVFLFEFLETQPRATSLLQSFYASYGITNWKNYIQRIAGIGFSIFKKTSNGYLELKIARDSDFDSNISFLDQLALVTHDEIEDEDFKIVRERPIHKIGEDTYLIISDLFSIEKIYKGLYFNLKAVNETLVGESKLPSWRNIYTFDFSEKVLLYKILSSSFPKKFIKIDGNTISINGYEGGPDYYVRNKNKAFIFESKNSLIPAGLKASANFTDLSIDLKIKFYRDGNSSKAVLQLLGVIKDIFSERFKRIDTDYKIEHIRFYPVLVIHDRQLNCPGFNKIINYWFREELSSFEGVDKKRIQDITVIDMATLTLVCELSQQRKFQLEEVIDEYHLYTSFRSSYASNDALMNHAHETAIPFSFFLDKFLKSRKLKAIPTTLLRDKSFVALEATNE